MCWLGIVPTMYPIKWFLGMLKDRCPPKSWTRIIIKDIRDIVKDTPVDI